MGAAQERPWALTTPRPALKHTCSLSKPQGPFATSPGARSGQEEPEVGTQENQNDPQTLPTL